MRQAIYVDLLLILNLVINYLLLGITGKCSKSSVKKGRLFLGAIFGALFSFIIFLPPMAYWLILLVKFSFSIIMVLVSFGWRSKTIFLKHTILFYVIGFLFAGCMMGGWIILSPPNMEMNNGVVYFNFSMVILLFSTIVIYLILNIVLDLYGKVGIKNTEFLVEMRKDCKVLHLHGFLDTGNKLRDVYTGKPVIIVPFSLGKKLVNPEIAKEIEAYFYPKKEESQPTGKVRYIPYKSVSVSAILPAVPLDCCSIEKEGKRIEWKEIMMAMSKEHLGDKSFDVLLNGLLFSER